MNTRCRSTIAESPNTSLLTAPRHSRGSEPEYGHVNGYRVSRATFTVDAYTALPVLMSGTAWLYSILGMHNPRASIQQQYSF